MGVSGSKRIPVLSLSAASCPDGTSGRQMLHQTDGWWLNRRETSAVMVYNKESRPDCSSCNMAGFGQKLPSLPALVFSITANKSSDYCCCWCRFRRCRRWYSHGYYSRGSPFLLTLTTQINEACNFCPVPQDIHLSPQDTLYFQERPAWLCAGLARLTVGW